MTEEETESHIRKQFLQSHPQAMAANTKVILSQRSVDQEGDREWVVNELSVDTIFLKKSRVNTNATLWKYSSDEDELSFSEHELINDLGRLFQEKAPCKTLTEDLAFEVGGTWKYVNVEGGISTISSLQLTHGTHYAHELTFSKTPTSYRDFGSQNVLMEYKITITGRLRKAGSVQEKAIAISLRKKTRASLIYEVNPELRRVLVYMGGDCSFDTKENFVLLSQIDLNPVMSTETFFDSLYLNEDGKIHRGVKKTKTSYTFSTQWAKQWLPKSSMSELTNFLNNSLQSMDVSQLSHCSESDEVFIPVEDEDFKRKDEEGDVRDKYYNVWFSQQKPSEHVFLRERDLFLGTRHDVQLTGLESSEVVLKGSIIRHTNVPLTYEQSPSRSQNGVYVYNMDLDHYDPWGYFQGVKSFSDFSKFGAEVDHVCSAPLEVLSHLSFFNHLASLKVENLNLGPSQVNGFINYVAMLTCLTNLTSTSNFTQLAGVPFEFFHGIAPLSQLEGIYLFEPFTEESFRLFTLVVQRLAHVNKVGFRMPDFSLTAEKATVSAKKGFKWGTAAGVVGAVGYGAFTVVTGGFGAIVAAVPMMTASTLLSPAASTSLAASVGAAKGALNKATQPHPNVSKWINMMISGLPDNSSKGVMTLFVGNLSDNEDFYNNLREQLTLNGKVDVKFVSSNNNSEKR